MIPENIEAQATALSAALREKCPQAGFCCDTISTRGGTGIYNFRVFFTDDDRKRYGKAIELDGDLSKVDELADYFSTLWKYRKALAG